MATQSNSSPNVKRALPGTPRTRQDAIRLINFVVLLLSVLLIVYISIDTFKRINFLENHHYMVFQFWVCLAFMASFFLEMWLSDDRWRYARHHWLFFLLSIPILNIINQFNLQLTPEELYFLRFIPLARGALAIAIIVKYFTRNRVASVFITYSVILLLVVYFCSLIVYEREQPVNPQIPDFWEALWFSSMVVTTIGCNIAPMTVSGKIIQIVLAAMGMIMFPLFTVYVTSMVMRLRGKAQAAKQAAMTASTSDSSTTTTTATVPSTVSADDTTKVNE